MDYDTSDDDVMDADGGATAAESEAPQSAEDKKLDKLYDRIPLLLAHLTDGNVERHNALDRLLKTFEKINELEASLIAEGEEHSPISMTRLYDLASSGGGSADLDDLKAANAAFAEENAILADTIESLAFQLKKSKDVAADELIGKDLLTKATGENVQQAITDVKSTIDDIHSRLAFLQNGENDNGKPLHERLAEEFSGFDDISAELLKNLPGKRSRFGMVLTRLGLSSDYKDAEAARQLIVAVLKANKEIADVIATLRPAQEQIDRLHEVLTLLETVAGHEERQQPQYQSALEEIDRLNHRIAVLEEKQGTIEELDESIAALEEQRAQTAEDAAQEQDSQKEKLAEAKAKVQEIEAELKALEEEKALHDKDEQDLHEVIKSKDSTIANLTSDKDEMQKGFDEERETHRHKELSLKVQIAGLRDTIRGLEGGLLVEKLEYEIATARHMAETAEKDAADQREKRKAFEERVSVWVKDTEGLKEELSSWRDKALKKYAITGLKVTGIASLAGVFGYAAAGLAQHVPPTYFWMVGIGAPTAAGVIKAMFKHMEGDVENSFNGDHSGLFVHYGSHSLKYALLGAFATAVYIPLSNSYMSTNNALYQDYQAHKAAVHEEYRQQVLDACGESPCMIMPQEDGSTRIVRLADRYAGESVVFTFPEDGGAEAPDRVILHQPFVPQAAPGLE